MKHKDFDEAYDIPITGNLQINRSSPPKEPIYNFTNTNLYRELYQK